MCKLSTCCLFLLIQFFWHFCFCWKIFNVYAQPKHPESSPENPGVCSNIVPPLNRSPSLEHVVPWHIFNGTGPVWLFPASLLPCSWKKTSCKPEIQATISHLVDLFWSSISHQQSSSYMNYPKTIPTSRFHKAMMMLRGPAPSAGRAWVKAFHIRPSKPWSKVTWTAWDWWAKRYLEDIYIYIT